MSLSFFTTKMLSNLQQVLMNFNVCELYIWKRSLTHYLQHTYFQINHTFTKLMLSYLHYIHSDKSTHIYCCYHKVSIFALSDLPQVYKYPGNLPGILN